MHSGDQTYTECQNNCQHESPQDMCVSVNDVQFYYHFEEEIKASVIILQERTRCSVEPSSGANRVTH